MKKVPYGVKAELKTASKAEMEEVAIYGTKGIPFQSPNGKVWIFSIDDNGNPVATEVTE